MAARTSISTLEIIPSKLRSSRDEPSVKAEYSGGANNRITFLHPGYPDEFKQNVLLRTQAFDRDGGGLHYGTALAACRLVAGNSSTGFFTLQRDGSQIELQHDELLRHDKYYFYNPDAENKRYPVYRSFKDWTFPHDALPPEWSAMVDMDPNNNLAPPSASNLTSFINARDKACRVSEKRGSDYFERAHLCPRSEAEWFEANGMGEYNQNQSLSRDWILDDVHNAIALRKDIHSAFDDRKFAIVPKESKWVVQFMGHTNGLGNDFHNTHIELKGVSSQFLYARFAWTIFPSLESFFEARVPREILVRVTENGAHREMAKYCAVEELQAAVPSRSRSSSPRKRTVAAFDDEQVTRKRTCHSSLKNVTEVVNANRRYNSTNTPLIYRSSVSPPSISTPASPAQLIFDKEKYIRSRRPSDPRLYCCNYNVAEAASRAASEFGGGYLCDQCLGMEYPEDRDNEF